MSDLIAKINQAINNVKNNEAIVLLQNPSVKPHINEKVGLSTCLQLACMKNNWIICEALLKAGADPEIADVYSGTALHAAADNGHLKCVQILVKHGAKLNAKGHTGLTAYDLAKHNGHDEVAEYLRDKMVENGDLAGGSNRQKKLSTSLSEDVPFYGSQNVSKKQNKVSKNLSYDVPDSVPMNYGYGYQVINEKLTEIQAENTQQRNKTNKRIDHLEIVQNQTKGEISNVKSQVDVLSREQQRQGDKVKQLEEQVKELAVTKRTSQRDSTLRSSFVNEDAQELADRVRSNFCHISKNMVADDHKYYLYQEKALSGEDLDVLDSLVGNAAKANGMLRMLLQKPNPSWVYAFLHSLQEHEVTRELANLLMENDTESE